MRRLSTAVALMALLLGFVPSAGAASLRSEIGPGYIATDNVEWLGNIPINTDSAGGRLLDGYFYISDDRGLTIYDVTDPASPSLEGFAPVPQGAYFVEEDLDTNGEIALIGSYGDLAPNIGPLNRLLVIDVSDKSNPHVLSELQGVDSHTVSCVLDCTYAYNSDGKIIDLTDPTSPQLVGNWAEADGPQGVRGAHDVTEVAPGIVVTSSNPMLVLDATENPASPSLIGSGKPSDNRFMHGNLWPQGGTDAFVLAGGETGGDCADESDGAFMTFRPSTDPQTGEITMEQLDEYRVFTGLPTEGNSPYDQYCAHWFDTHPTYADGGLVAMGWYEHGTRFLDVAAETGEITERGWFYPVGGSTSAAYWITEEIVYAVDYQRGIDILRFTDAPATGTRTVPASAGYVATTAAAAPLTSALRARLTADPYACPLPGL
jgi:hypothetical protein